MIKELFTIDNIQFLLSGLVKTLYISLISILLSTLFGTVIGVLKHSKKLAIKLIPIIYVDSIRNVPLLLFILAVRVMTNFSIEIAGITAITIFTSAIIAEIVRGGLNSIPKGQWEAAKSQGFTYVKTLRYIILPQAFKAITPPMISQFITVVKDTSYLYPVLTIEELTGKGMIMMGEYKTVPQIFAIYIMIALIYFCINYPMSVYARNRQKKSIW